MKHAYLIVAHTDFKILERLLDLLVYPGNDIYVHIDKKVSYDIKYHPVYSKLFTVSNEHRIDVRWADCTIAWAEMELYKLAHNHGPYGYYHLMSGIDLPLKSQNFIHRFFEEHNGIEFYGLMQNAWRTKSKIMYYHLFTKHLRGFGWRSQIEGILNSILVKLQKILPIMRSHKEIPILVKGTTWSSLTEEAVSYILSKQDYIYKRFRYTFACDEIYKPILLINSPFVDKFYSKTDEYKGCLRKVDWQRGNPYIWQLKDYDELINSNMLFARKFSSEHWDLVEKISDYVNNNKNVV